LVLEPPFQKSLEKKPRSLFGKEFGIRIRRIEFFGKFDDFYILTEYITMNPYNEYIVISTLKGFKLLTPNKKVRIPDIKDLATASIVVRLVNQKPLGMFRLSDFEFLLCCKEVSVYMNKHGDISPFVVMEHVGKAKTVLLYGIYLVLFNIDSVEVRNVETAY